MLQYYLVANHITPDPDDYMAVSINPESYSLEDIFDHMTREGSTITKAEALAGFEEVTQGILNLVEQGHSVNTPLVNISLGINGVFNGDDWNERNIKTIRTLKSSNVMISLTATLTNSGTLIT
jgi:hypothetical protein